MNKTQISVITALEGKGTLTSVKRLSGTVYECVCVSVSETSLSSV